MPARGQGRNDAAEMIDAIVRIAGDPEGHKKRIAEFYERERAAVEAEAAAKARIEEADKREADLDQREAALEARLAAHEGEARRVLDFQNFVREQWREIQAAEQASAA